MLLSSIFLALGFAASLSSAASCARLFHDEKPAVASADIRALAVALHTNTFTSGKINDSIPIKGTESILFRAGTAQVCVRNDHQTQDAYYSRTDIAYAIAQSFDQCCKGTQFCKRRPSYTVRGDNGLPAILHIDSSGSPPPWRPCKNVDANNSGDLAAGEIELRSGKLFYAIFRVFNE